MTCGSILDRGEHRCSSVLCLGIWSDEPSCHRCSLFGLTKRWRENESGQALARDPTDMDPCATDTC